MVWVINEALDSLAAIIAGKRVVPSMPVGESVVISDYDATDEVDSQTSENSTDGAALALFIEYVDGEGQRTRRRVTVRQLIGQPPDMVLAYCHERRAARHFRIDRIVEAIHPETGEILAGAEILLALQGAGFSPIDPVVRRMVNAMGFIMRCDGQAHAAEWEAIDDALAFWICRNGGDDAEHQAAMQMARQVAPDHTDFMIAMRSMVASKQVRQLAPFMQRALGSVMDADGVLHANEVGWAREIDGFLRAAAERDY